MIFQDFLLRITRQTDEALFLQLLDSPTGQCFCPQPAGPDLPDIYRLAEAFSQGRLDQAGIERLGSKLYRLIFPPPLERHFKASQEAAPTGLRLQLYLSQPELAGLPWELLFDPDRRCFLALDYHTPVIRYWAERQSTAPRLMSGPLRGVVAMAAPTDLAPLEIEKEQHNIQVALEKLAADRKVVIDWVQPASRLKLLSCLSQGAHFLHFIGHGWYFEAQNEGGLVLVNEAGTKDALSAQELSGLLQGLPLQLIVLGACRSQHTALAAQAVLKAGGAAVLAYQTPVEDSSAINFSTALYGDLGNGAPLERAITTARKAIQLTSPVAGAWAAPVLSMGYRAGDFRLFTERPQSALRNMRLSLPPEPYYPIKSRESQLGQVLAALQQQRSCQISGSGGLGKTALAIEAARRCLSQTGQWERFVWASAKQEVLLADELLQLQDATLTYEALLNTIGEQMGYPEVLNSPVTRKEGTVADILAPGGCLVIVDNLENFENTEMLILRLSALLGKSQLLVTTRHQTSGNLAAHTLSGLDEPDSLYFIRREAAERGIQAILTAEEQDLLSIHEATGGNPLVMKLVVSQVNWVDLDWALDQLAHPEADIYRYIYHQTYKLLSDEAKIVLNYIASEPASVSWEDLRMATSDEFTDERLLQQATQQLVRLSLVLPVGAMKKRYSVHQLTRNFVMNQLPEIWDQAGE